MWELKFKRKPKPQPEEFKEKQAYIPQTEEHAPKFSSSLTDYSNHVSKMFNDYCTEMGVQCSVGMNPSDCTRQIAFKVVGNRDVKIEYRGQVHYLAPGDTRIIKIEQGMDYKAAFPKLTLLPYGNAAAQQNAGIEGWQNYRFHQGAIVVPGVQRQFFQYGELSPSTEYDRVTGEIIR